MDRRQFLFAGAAVLLPASVFAKENTKLIVYCGVTMAKALGAIAEQFKRLHPDVEVVILRGGSKDLYDTLASSRKGDLYLPGDPSYVTDHLESGLFNGFVEIGYNQMALMVPKGNPKQIQPELQSLLRHDLVTVLSTPDQGAIGLETQQVLEANGLYESAIAHASLLMSDGRSLTQAIQRGEGDVCLNWRAGVNFAPNEVELVELPDSIAPRQALLLAKLSFTQHAFLADQFMQLATSEIGQGVMRSYGFN